MLEAEGCGGIYAMRFTIFIHVWVCIAKVDLNPR